MKVKFKKLDSLAVTPKYAKEGDAGMDLIAISDGIFDQATHTLTYSTGIAVEIPDGYVGLVFPRSSVYKAGGRQSNSVGVIDSGYRGEILVKHDFSPISSVKVAVGSVNQKLIQGVTTPEFYKKGDKIAQLIILPYPKIELEETDELSDSDRGEGGFGSTDKSD